MLVAYLAAAAALYPGGLPVANAGGARMPGSSLDPLPEYTKDQVIEIRYTANGTAGSSGVAWTELSYRLAGSEDWVLYAPPWNPSGQWPGSPLNDAQGGGRGTILFDTYFTGGEGTYEFSSVTVDRGYWREDGPDAAKARTTLDTRPPQIFVATPTPGAWTNDDVLTWVASDAVSGIAEVGVSLDGSSVGSSPDPEGSVELPLEAEGDHAALVRALDRAGNAAEVLVPFHYDPSAPGLAITAPARDGFVNATDVEVRWAVESSGAGLASLRLTVDSNPAIELAPDADRHLLESLAEKGHVISLLAVDLAGNVAAETLSFGVDTTPPELELLAPPAITNARDLQVIWLGYDATSGIDRYELSLDGGSKVVLGPAAGYTFPGVPEGDRVVEVVAVDKAGNSANVSKEVTVDATLPVVGVTNPTGAAVVYGPLDVNWTASDAGSGLAKVELIFDGAAPIVATDGSGHRFRDVAVGPHYVLVRATDRAGNVRQAGVAFDYGGLTPPGGGPSDLPGLDFWFIMAILGAIAVGSAYYAVRRRKRAQA